MSCIVIRPLVYQYEGRYDEKRVAFPPSRKDELRQFKSFKITKYDPQYADIARTLDRGSIERDTIAIELWDPTDEDHGDWVHFPGWSFQRDKNGNIDVFYSRRDRKDPLLQRPSEFKEPPKPYTKDEIGNLKASAIRIKKPTILTTANPRSVVDVISPDLAKSLASRAKASSQYRR